jgi:hypothetical protein
LREACARLQIELIASYQFTFEILRTNVPIRANTAQSINFLG